MLPTMDQFKARIDNAVAEQVEWLKAEFCFGNLPLDVKIVDVPTGPLGQARVLRKARAFAGFQVKFQAYHFLREEVQSYAEYATYNDWPEIGGFATESWELAVDALVAHELAHIVQFALHEAGAYHPLFVSTPDRKGMFFNDIGRYEGGHSYFFRQIYKRFRRRFINQRITNEDYTAPRSMFKDSGEFEERMEAKTGEHPLIGIRFMFRGKTYEVAGRNPRNAKLFGYMVKTPAGDLAKIKLSVIISYSPEAKAIVAADPALTAELTQLVVAQHTKRLANAKSSLTKRIRGQAARRSMVAHG